MRVRAIFASLELRIFNLHKQQTATIIVVSCQTSILPPMISFVVTGFGPFGDVKENPTTALVNSLSEHLSTLKDVPPTRTMVIETSAVAAKEQVDALYDDLTKEFGHTEDKAVVVLIHLGVNVKNDQGFELESCAYNEATFRIPDERGHQPQMEPIIAGAAVGTELSTLLDVSALVGQLSSISGSGVDGGIQPNVTVSTDPGRFVCNYTYCYSLDKFKCSHQATTTQQDVHFPYVRCLFLHVPPFSVVPQSEQMRFVSSLMLAIKEQLSHQNDVMA
jgi:pyroglutamyl-peptidase